MEINLPNKWVARHYQSDVWRYMTDGTPEARNKRAICIWHRRAGKDSFGINFTAVMAHRRVGTYWHMLPSLQQARRVVWDGIDRDGRRIIDQAIPKELRRSVNNTEMKIELKNGSIWQCVGSDNYDSLVGTNPIGVIFSEFAIADPRSWDYLRPILAENEGWAMFISTPRGKNFFHDMYQMARGNPLWYSDLLTIADTFRDHQKTLPVMTKETYDAELAAGMDVLLAQQEFYCGFDAGQYGAYYTDQLNKAKIGDYPWDPKLPVHTSWDIGLRDATAIWFFQQYDRGAIHVIDYWEDNNVPLSEWCKRVSETSYTFGTHVGPHDLEQRDKGFGVRLIDTASDLGIQFEIAPRVSIKSGIDAVKDFIPKLRFNQETTQKGFDALANYRRERNDKLQVFLDRPLHDWASHGADSIRYAALAYINGLPSTHSWAKPIDYSMLSRMVV